MPSKMTITEALAELKTIEKRLNTKRQNTLQYIARDSRVKDPLEREGGSVEFLRSERQSIRDLEARIISIRKAIASSNHLTVLTIEGVTKSIFEWLTWRREVAPNSQQYLALLQSNVKQMRDKLQREGRNVVASTDETKASPGDAVINLSEKELMEDLELFDKMLGTLDGKLSLLNATTVVEFE
jgi:hypothetical protein